MPHKRRRFYIRKQIRFPGLFVILLLRYGGIVLTLDVRVQARGRLRVVRGVAWRAGEAARRPATGVAAACALNALPRSHRLDRAVMPAMDAGTESQGCVALGARDASGGEGRPALYGAALRVVLLLGEALYRLDRRVHLLGDLLY